MKKRRRQAALIVPAFVIDNPSGPGPTNLAAPNCAEICRGRFYLRRMEHSLRHDLLARCMCVRYTDTSDHGYSFVTILPNPNTPFTRHNRLSGGLCNRFDNRLYTRYSRLSNRLSNPRLNDCIHDTTGCQSGLTTGLTTGCIVYTNI